jgi:hypothetical protein
MPHNAWISHVLRYWKSHPSLSYGDCLKKARASYHPVGARGAKPVNPRKPKRKAGARVAGARVAGRRRRAGMY